MTLRSAILAAVTGETAQETDPYYNLVSLHLKGDVNTGRSYNAFSDASSNNFRLTNSGEVRGSSFSPYNTSWSNYFSGSSQYLSLSDNAAFAFGSGDLTIECWVYATTSGLSQGIAGQANSSVTASLTSFVLYLVSTSKISAEFYVGSTLYVVTSSNNLVYNQWNHIAVVRDGGTIRLYINGQQDGTVAISGSINDSANQLAIGRLGEYTSWYWNGYISNFRIVKGRCVYPSGTAFNPSTAPLTRTTGGTNPPQGTECSLLTCQSNRFIDNSIANTGGTAFTITPSGSPTVSSFSPFLETDTTSGSGYFDGSGDFLSTTNVSALQLTSSTAFTIEFWWYPTSLSAQQYVQSAWVVGSTGYAIAAGVYTFSVSELAFFDGTTWRKIGNPVLNAWNHIAIVSSGTSNTGYLYLNGSPSAAFTVASTINYTSGTWYLGQNSSSGAYANGYVTDFRLLKGTNLYPSGTAFTPPTAPLTAVANTQLLTLQERGAYNTVGFQDDSEYQHVITRPSGANVAQGTFSPFSNSGWSNYFDGSSYLANTSTTSVVAPGTSNFTAEFWMYATTDQQSQGYGTVLHVGSNTAGCFLIILLYSSAGAMKIRFSTSTTDYDSTSTISTNRWYHIAVVREGTGSNQTKMYVDGSLFHTFTLSDNLSNSSGLYIGATAFGLTVRRLSGYVSNIRLTNGTALYTGAFTPSTTPLTTTSQGATATQVELLTCQSNRFLDNSSNGWVFTTSGSPSVQAFSPFAPIAYDAAVHGGSGYFDGTGDYLSGPANAAFAQGTGDFTVEAWVFPTGNGSSTPGIFDCRVSGNEAGGFLLGLNTSYAPIFYTDTLRLTGSKSCVLNAWNYVVLTRSSGTATLWLNGESIGTVANSTNFTTQGCYIGMAYTGVNNPFMGYIATLRVVKGTAVYTSNFTSPSGPLPLLGNTSLLLNFTNGGVIDSTGKNVIETVGNAGVVTTTIKKYGSGSMYFDGTGDWLQAPTSPSLSFGSAPYTIEFWYRPNEVSNDVSLIAKYSTSFEWVVQYLPSASNSFRVAVNNNQVSDFASALSINTWYHIALCRDSSGNLRFFRDGVQVGSTVTSGTGAARDITATNDYLTIGVRGAGTQPTNGYIDDLRITKGYARYTTGTGANANQMVFTGTNTLALPTKAHPDRGTTSTLTTDMAAPSSVEALVVAGGGGGGAGFGGTNAAGGGGAGGFREFVGGNALAVSAGTNYQLTIGAGGPGATAAQTDGSKGGNSIFSTVTSTGGGFGAKGAAGVNIQGGPGGSGGGAGSGAAATQVGGVGNQGGYSPVEGNNGGSSGGGYTGGGGGGAGGAGDNGPQTGGSAGGSGGIGLQSTISGISPSPFYAGGGGGMGYLASTGGSGVGGNGGSSINSTLSTAGTTNTGGGGGAGGYNAGLVGSAGGSGIVIIAYPTSFRPLKASLGLVYTIDTVTRPGYRVYKFTAGTGSISW